jgi:hypothetical protein
MIRQQEPLTPEERELAAYLSRLGPHGEPSPALDSRIMAAAHADLAKTNTHKPKPRWPVALGLAASVLLAVGVAWQLRPLQEAPTASEAPNAAAAPESQSMVQAPMESQDDVEAKQAAADAAAPPVSPPQGIPEATEPRIRNLAPAPRREAQKPAPSNTAPPATGSGGTTAKTTASPVIQAPAPRSTDRYSPPPAPPAPARSAAPPAAAPAPAMSAASDAERTERSAVQAEQAAQAKRARDEATSSRLLLRESEQRRRQESISVSAASAAAQDAVAEESGARATLRRTDLQLPVVEDAKLAPAEWLDRIRLRRDLGDSGNASASLRMFVDAHPFQRVPEDLRPLLGEE